MQGLDVSIWKDKLNLTVDYFIKTTSDMLIPDTLTINRGQCKTSLFKCRAKWRNKGFEVELNYKNNDHLFKYDVGVNFSTLQIKVLLFKQRPANRRREN
jgi:hypothetical protein